GRARVTAAGSPTSRARALHPDEGDAIECLTGGQQLDASGAVVARVSANASAFLQVWRRRNRDLAVRANPLGKFVDWCTRAGPEVQQEQRGAIESAAAYTNLDAFDAITVPAGEARPPELGRASCR